MRRSAQLFGLILLLSALSSSAQINTGKITGFVSDTSGAIITAVPVMAVNDATGVVTQTTTSGTGEYLINFLVPGTT